MGSMGTNSSTLFNITTTISPIYPDIIALKKSMYLLTVPIIVVFCLLGILANGAILLAARMIKSSNKEYPTMPITLSLATSDLWTSGVMAFSLVHNSYIYFVFGLQANPCVALTFEAVRTGGFITGSLHLLALALVHYLTIRCPTKYHTFITNRSNWIVIILIWVCPPVTVLIFMCSVPGEFFRSPYNPNVGYCHSFRPWKKFQFRLIVFFIFFACFILTSILYIMFLRLFRKQGKKFGRLPKSDSMGKKQKRGNRQFWKNRRTFTTTVFICITFFLGWIPSCALFVLTCETCPFPVLVETPYNVKIMFILGVIGNTFILLKSIINPIIYAIRIPEIKSALYKQYSWCPFLVDSANENCNSRRTVSMRGKGVGTEEQEESELSALKRTKREEKVSESRGSSEQFAQENCNLLKGVC